MLLMFYIELFYTITFWIKNKFVNYVWLKIPQITLKAASFFRAKWLISDI